MSECIRWRIGEVSATKLVELEASFPGGGPTNAVPDAFPDEVRKIGWLTPAFATAQGHLIMSVHALLLETPSGRFIVDTCAGNHKKRASPMFNMLNTPFLDELEKLGWTPDSVDGVLCTHLHADHVGWNTTLSDGSWRPTFPNARYFIGRAEYAHWAANSEPDRREMMDDSVRPLFDAQLVELVDVNARLTPELRLTPTPGHTPGHVSVIIESAGERAVITGDVMHHPCQIARPDWSSAFDDDQDRSRATRRIFLSELCGTSTLVIGTHFPGPTAGLIVEEAGAYRLARFESSRM